MYSGGDESSDDEMKEKKFAEVYGCMAYSTVPFLFMGLFYATCYYHVDKEPQTVE